LTPLSAGEVCSLLNVVGYSRTIASKSYISAESLSKQLSRTRLHTNLVIQFDDSLQILSSLCFLLLWNITQVYR